MIDDDDDVSIFPQGVDPQAFADNGQPHWFDADGEHWVNPYGIAVNYRPSGSGFVIFYGSLSGT